jgi:quercetin dioxygenase-like cupin family protein
MLHFAKEEGAPKGWLTGPWNGPVPVAVGYANAGIDEPHTHAQMYEIYLVAQGHSTAIVEGQWVHLEMGSVLIVEPGELHTFVESSPDYYHFVIHAPVVQGDKQLRK